jgi:archaellum biogenesis protein FlaJ (TadC family)
MSGKINGRTYSIIGMIIFILVFIIDRFIFEIPVLIYIIILLAVIILLFTGLWLRKKERDNMG